MKKSVTSYSNSGVPPGRVPPLRDPSFTYRYLDFIVTPRDVLRSPGEPLSRANIELITLSHKLIHRVSHKFTVPIDSALDTSNFRSCKESLYGPNLANVVL